MTPPTPTSDYPTFLTELKTRIRQAQLKAALSVNKELILLYWKIGKDILANQEKLGWGAKVIDQLSQDLRTEFPEIKGFSVRNLKYMQAFAASYPDLPFVQEVLAQLPRCHLCVIITRLKDPEVRLFYLKKTIEHGWSRNILVHQIKSGLHLREGASTTNFFMIISERNRWGCISVTKTCLIQIFRSNINPEVIVKGQIPIWKERSISVWNGFRTAQKSSILHWILFPIKWDYWPGFWKMK